MYCKLPKSESNTRIKNLIDTLNRQDPAWDTALICGRVNHYYLAGTMQDAVLVIRQCGDVHLFVRRSYDRAVEESPLENIHPMQSYREMHANLRLAYSSSPPDLGLRGEEALPANLGRTYIETEQVPLAMLNRLQKYFRMEQILPLDNILCRLRAVKSPYELSFMKEAGKQHDHLLIDIVPDLLTEGMTESELFGRLYNAMMQLGHHGLVRFSGFGSEMQLGQIGFGTNTLAPTNFDGPGGMLGMSAAVPSVGGRDRRLRKGDMVFVDIGFGCMGYHTDKTQIYSFNARLPERALSLHAECIEVEQRAASRLKCGNIPAEIYTETLSELSPALAENFMGYQNRRVQFLGHGIGLVVNEYPVIARGFNEPLQENMTIALEPKCGVSGVGTVGVEDTYLVTASGGRCLTGGGRPVLEI